MLNKFIIIILVIIYFTEYSLLQPENNCSIKLKYLRSCDSGECINSLNYCDDKIDCLDKSDETEIHCNGYSCPKNTFKCKYGGCTNITNLCNGKYDCIDGSDEENCFLSDQLNITIVKKRQAGCESELEAQCRNGQCIQRIDFCDGILNCNDGSDETYETCFDTIPCRNGFKCQYGACISKIKVCDGQMDCADNSDESITYAKCNATLILPLITPQIITVPIPKTKCVVPNIKNLVMYRTQIASQYFEPLLPGETVENSQKLYYYNCENKYKLRNYDDLPNIYINSCHNNNWISHHPTCTRLCHNRELKGVSFLANCNGKKNDCSDKEWHLPGTKAKISCQYKYIRPNTFYDSVLCQEDGNWNFAPKRCEPQCGVVSSALAPFVINGTATEIYDVPWHAAIFELQDNDYKNICGGTIINAGLIISAAHCFWNNSKRANETRLMDNKLFQIVVGTTARSYSNRSLDSQTFSVTEIIPYEGFEGSKHGYLHDIALIILNSTITFDNFAIPICLDRRHTSTKIPSGVLGKIAGWGETAPEHREERLHAIEMKSLSYDDCKFKVANLGTFKFCLDVENSFDQYVCFGDSGGGFVQPVKENNIERYILRGILSSGHYGLVCGNKAIAHFTDIYVFDYIEFLEKYEYRNNPN